MTLPRSLCDTNGKRLMAIAPWLWSSSRLYKDFTGNKNELQGKTNKVLLVTSVLRDQNTPYALFVISIPMHWGAEIHHKVTGKIFHQTLPKLILQRKEKKLAQRRGSVKKASTAVVGDAEGQAKISWNSHSNEAPRPERRAKGCL